MSAARTARPIHLVCYAPYTNWSIHSARQVTILQALRRRGCSVSYIACDAAFSLCDMTQAANGAAIAAGPQACLTCQSSVAARLATWGMPYRWLGRWIKRSDAAVAQSWVTTLSPADFAAARYEGSEVPAGERWDIGAWVRSSVHTHFRHNVLDLTNPEVAAIYAAYLVAGLIAALALTRVFDQERPAAQLLFNGRMSSTRIALELARQRGIRTFCEERSTIAGRMSLFVDAHCLDLTAADALWDDWRDIPLSEGEIAELSAVFAERWSGRSTDVSAFSTGAEALDTVAARLDLDRRRPIWTLFTSSLDESIDEPRSTGAFATQAAWISATADCARAHPEIQLVIRVHPNSGSKRSLGRNIQDQAFFAQLAERLPTNARIVAGDDDTSSYSLAALSTLGLVWYSTIGLEMAAVGKPVIRAGASWLADCDAFIGANDPAAYRAALESKGRASGAQAMVQAWRFAYAWYFRQSIPFPLVHQPTWYAGEPAYTALEQLAPGADAHLDRICAAIMSQEPLHPRAAPRPDIDLATETALIRRHVASFTAGSRP